MRILGKLVKRNKATGYQPWHGWLLLIVAVFAITLGLIQRVNQPAQDQTEPVIPAILNQATCTAAGGDWNDCGDACRGNLGDACIQVCVEYCECRSSEQCPFGFECGDFYRDTGICLEQ